MGQIQSIGFVGNQVTNNYDKEPDKCPFCHNRITPRTYNGYHGKYGLEIVYRCSNQDCQRLFLGIYKKDGNIFKLYSTSIGIHEPRLFSDNINTLSPNFVEIYNQALTSEHYTLEHLSGMGYRKALEFIIKDYLISILSPEKENDIKDKFLGKCIKQDVDNQNLKDIAERAAWLGNDETHYVRKWENKDITDLKKLIDVAVHWIEMELLTKQYKEEMT